MSSSPTLFVRAKQPRSTEALGVYWKFARARQDLYLARLRGGIAPEPSDVVLATNRFTNAFRASDRVSQYLISKVIYDGVSRPFEDEFARVILFKLFNRISTWESLQSVVGPLSAKKVLDGRVADAVEHLSRQGRVYSAAYIMPPPRHLHGCKARRHAILLAQMIADGVPARVKQAKTMSEVFKVLRGVPSIGPFLAYQYAIDLNYGPSLSHSENSFVTPGPGALRGLRKCYSDLGDLSPSDAIRFTRDSMLQESSRANVTPPDLFGRRPTLIDLQNLFCEVDKYTRVARPDLCGEVPGARIKQRYVANPEPISSWFPPDWKLNERAAEWRNRPEPSSPGSPADGSTGGREACRPPTLFDAV